MSAQMMMTRMIRTMTGYVALTHSDTIHSNVQFKIVICTIMMKNLQHYKWNRFCIVSFGKRAILLTKDLCSAKKFIKSVI